MLGAVIHQAHRRDESRLPGGRVLFPSPFTDKKVLVGRGHGIVPLPLLLMGPPVLGSISTKTPDPAGQPVLS